MKLWKQVFIGLILGVILGVTLKEQAAYLRPLGDVFIRLIKMIIVPLIFFAIVGGMTSSRDTKTLHSIGIKAIGAYITTTLIAIFIGLFVGNTLKPGAGMALELGDAGQSITSSGDHWIVKIFHILLNVIPDNAVGAMAQGTILQVVFFALFVGYTINHLDQKDAERLASLFQLFSRIVFKMVQFIIRLSPLAACTLTAWVVGTQGLNVLVNLAALIGCAYFAFGLQYIVFGALIYFWTGMSPKPFYKKSMEYQLIAFSTSSSKAALPTTMEVCQKKLGISETSSSFVLPLGASINMDGIAIYLGLCVMFFAQAMGHTFSMADYAVIVLTSTLGAIGGAGIPGGTMVMLPMVMGSVGLPIEGIALVVGIDRLIDMMRTTISITGDAAVTLCVDHSEGLLDKNTYHSQETALKTA